MFLFINTCIEVAIRGCPDVNRCPRGIDVNIAAASFCKKIYLENMRKFVENNWQIFRRVMETKHEEFKNYSINRYHDLTYLRGDESQYQPYEQQIIDSMEKYFISLKKARTKKEALVLIGTIVAFAGVAGVCIRVFLGIAARGGAASGEAAVAGATVASAGGVSSVVGAIKTGVSLYEKYIEIKKLNSEDNQLSDTLPQTPSSLTEFTVIEDPLIHIQNLTQSSVNVNINYNNNNNFYTLR
jgi:alkylhydroperoxidase/carboxymuconolactone decarboxylase family protein YurZ